MSKTGPKTDLTNVEALPLHDEPQAAHVAKSDALRPDDLCPQSRGYWDRLGPHLVMAGRLRPLFVDAFSEYCRISTRLVNARKILDEGEWTYVVKGRNGEQRKSHPSVAQLNDDWRKWKSLTGDFGLTPYAERTLKGESQGDLFDGFEDL